MIHLMNNSTDYWRIDQVVKTQNTKIFLSGGLYGGVCDMVIFMLM